MAGDVGVNQYIVHNGDADTYINFTDDRIRFNAGGINLFGMHQKSSAPHQVTVNNGNNNVDFVVLTDDASDEALLRCDASANKVGIGTGSPSHKLDVNGDIRVRGNDIRDNSGNPAITFDGSANTSIPGALTAAKQIIMGNESVGAGTSQTISLDKPLTFVSNLTGDLTGSVADGSTHGETKWIVTNGYNASNDLKISFDKCAWNMGGAGHVNLMGGILQVVWGGVGGSNMWYALTMASGSFQQGA